MNAWSKRLAIAVVLCGCTVRFGSAAARKIRLECEQNLRSLPSRLNSAQQSEVGGFHQQVPE